MPRFCHAGLCRESNVIKLLIDECLSPGLALLARDRGYSEASHVVWIGKAGWKDWELKRVLLDGDWTLVTRNSNDFRGPVEAPGTRGQFADVAVHAGLICLNGTEDFDLTTQRELFLEALRELEQLEDLVNQVLEVTMIASMTLIEIVRYDLPQL